MAKKSRPRFPPSRAPAEVWVRVQGTSATLGAESPEDAQKTRPARGLEEELTNAPPVPKELRAAPVNDSGIRRGINWSMLAVVIPLLGAVGYAIYKFGRLENTVEFVQHQIENIATTSRELADEAVRTRSKLESIDTTLRRLNQDPESKSGTRKR